MLVGVTTGGSFAPLIVDVVAKMSGAPTMNYIVSVDQPVVPMKPSLTPMDSKRTMASTLTSSELNWKAKLTARPTKKTFLLPTKSKGN